jgi:uncharacterized membrane protein YraQ (UPF0718 family)
MCFSNQKRSSSIWEPGKLNRLFYQHCLEFPYHFVPVATGLKKQGANSGAALSFMIATPESGVDSIAVSWAMLDPIMTVVRPVAAFITAVSTGLAQDFFGTEGAPIKEAAPKKPGG